MASMPHNFPGCFMYIFRVPYFLACFWAERIASSTTSCLVFSVFFILLPLFFLLFCKRLGDFCLRKKLLLSFRASFWQWHHRIRQGFFRFPLIMAFSFLVLPLSCYQQTSSQTSGSSFFSFKLSLSYALSFLSWSWSSAIQSSHAFCSSTFLS